MRAFMTITTALALSSTILTQNSTSRSNSKAANTLHPRGLGRVLLLERRGQPRPGFTMRCDSDLSPMGNLPVHWRSLPSRVEL
jgi:hypothetical protein